MLSQLSFRHSNQNSIFQEHSYDAKADAEEKNFEVSLKKNSTWFGCDLTLILYFTVSGPHQTLEEVRRAVHLLL